MTRLAVSRGATPPSVLAAPQSELSELVALRDELDQLRREGTCAGRLHVQHSSASAQLDRLISRKQGEIDALSTLVVELHERRALR